jgi:hypothetical protein
LPEVRLRKTPTSVLVLSIIGIVWAAIGILGGCASIVVLTVHVGPPNPILDELNHDTAYVVANFINLGLGVPLAILLLVASIACLRLIAWARKTMIFFAWASIAQLVLGTLINIFFVYPRLFHIMDAAGPLPPGTKEAQIAGMAIGFCITLLTPIYPICIIYYFSRPKIVDAFSGIFPALPTAFPVQPDDPPQA